MLNPRSGKVQTVLGLIDADDLGVTLTHEHLLVDLRCYRSTPDEASERRYIERRLTMDWLKDVRRTWAYNNDNLTLLDEALACEEVWKYKLAGGNSLVDTTSIGIGRDPRALGRISRRTGLNVIMGASYYVPHSHPPDMDGRTEDTITEQIIGDISVGVGDTGIKSGIIGEIGCWNPMNQNVRKVLRASARAHVETGAPILVHPPFHPKAHEEVLDILVKAGADITRVIMGHLDFTRQDRPSIKSLAQTGCYLEWDTFGIDDTSATPLADLPKINDLQRLERLEWLAEDGFLQQVVIAHDVCTKNHLTSYGGKGFAHILENIVPRMHKRGWTKEQIDTILVDNPRRVLAFK